MLVKIDEYCTVQITWDVNREMNGWGLGEWLVLDGDSEDDLSDE